MLNVSELSVAFRQKNKIFRAVRGISFAIRPAEIVGIVGESGSGKSMTALAINGLLPAEAIADGVMHFAGKTLRFANSRDWEGLRGKKIGLVFQDAYASLNPLLTVGGQVAEALQVNFRLTKKEAGKKVLDLFKKLGIHPATVRFHQYPHQLSGGMQQRVMLAAAMACRPSLLVADEPTTALDVTLQAQILQLLRSYTEREKAAICFISHDLGVVAQLADRVMVMCGGVIVEKGSVYDVMYSPLHPYTRLLLNSLPRLDKPLEAPQVRQESKAELPGCVFAGRCSGRRKDCYSKQPSLQRFHSGREVACFLYS
ncbi:MAG: ABC transporter ATP-binding protein [Bacillota bacterium]|jgi:oligopeptide/dipeptide ABC transporter ATP-binding protein|nr:ABC transporter ATP-binding protein [Bacillota bacterium]HHU29499.1 ABC transporter ATP-binding protein [Bacillota bacterium]